MSVKRMVFIAMCTTILFVQELFLTFLPNIQFTVLLLVVYASVFSYRENVAIIFVHVILDNLMMGTLNPFYMIPMFFGWLMIPTLYRVLMRRSKSELKLAFFGILISVLYGWMFIPFNMIQTGIHIFWPYLLADIPFQIFMSISSFITILWLFPILHRTIDEQLKTHETSHLVVSHYR